LKILNHSVKIITFVGMAFIFYLTIPILTKPITQLPKESSELLDTLHKQGYKELSNIDLFILTLMGGAKEGEVKFRHKIMSRIDFLAKLSKSISVEVYKVTLIPGETIVVFFETLSKKYGFDKTKLLQAYKEQSTMEDGAIVPDTYFIGDRVSEEKMVSHLLSSSKRTHEKLALKLKGNFNEQEWQKYLIVASVVEKEAANKEEMPLVASVIYNRLAQNMRLQMDGTLNYGQYSHIKVTPQRIKEDNSGFNTYKHKGLPPYPICAVSNHAIESAINPAQSDYLYFMKNKKGTHDFTASYSSHLGNIQKAKE